MQDKVDQSVGHQWKSLSIQWLEGKGGGGGVEGSWDQADNLVDLKIRV